MYKSQDMPDIHCLSGTHSPSDCVIDAASVRHSTDLYHTIMMFGRRNIIMEVDGCIRKLSHGTSHKKNCVAVYQLPWIYFFWLTDVACMLALDVGIKAPEFTVRDKLLWRLEAIFLTTRYKEAELGMPQSFGPIQDGSGRKRVRVMKIGFTDDCLCN